MIEGGDPLPDVKGKNVLILGMGQRTTPPLAWALKELGACIFINDEKKEEDLKEVMAALSNLSYYLHAGDHRFSLDAIQLIVVNPAVPLQNPLLVEARRRGIPFIGELELAYQLCQAPIIAITGTNGKTTTTYLTGELLQAGKRRVVVGGNIGEALIGLVRGLTPEDLVVAEVSSFQLATIQKFRPHGGVLLNLAPDHLDYHGSFSAYQAAKKNLFLNQRPQDFVLLNADEPLFLSWRDEIPGNKYYFSTKREVSPGGFFLDEELIITLSKKEKILSLQELSPWGRFNKENILSAVVMAGLWGLERKQIREVLFNCKGLEHRLEEVGTWDGVTYFNSSKATNPHSTLWDLKCIPSPLILILGGQNRGLDFSPLYAPVMEKATQVILLGETAWELEAGFQKRGYPSISRVQDLEEGVYLAASMAEPGTIVLLSPACPSWDMFSSYQQRGQLFKELVKSIKEGSRHG